MGGRRHDEGRVCLCDRPDGTCARLAVQRLSGERVRELVEEIWTASSGYLPTVSPLGDPRSSRAGASADAAYRRRREEDRAAWRAGWAWRSSAVASAAVAMGLLIGLIFGAWLGWPMAIAAGGIAWSRLRFRLSPGADVWRRQAAMQRRTAGLLQALEHDGHLVLHDITLPGWLDSLDHVVVAPTGVWVIESWQRRRLLPGGGPPPAIVRGLRGQAAGVAEVLARRGRVPVRPVLCLHGSRPAPSHAVNGVLRAAPSQLLDVVRDGSPAASGEVERAADRLLEMLRPAA